MPYAENGTLTTDKREIAISETWDTQTEWEAYQSQNNIEISNGVVQLTFSEIPNSAIHRWKFDEGSGTTISDSIGSADGSVVGSTWITNTWQGGSALDGDGTDDYEDTTTLGTFGSSTTSDFAIAFTIQTTTAAENVVIGGVNFSSVESSGSQLLQIGLSRLSASGKPFVELRSNNETSGDLTRVIGDTAINNGNKYRIVWNKTGSGGSGQEIWINASEDTTTIDLDSPYDSAEDFAVDWYWHAVNSGGSPSKYIDASLDDPIIYNDSLTAQEIQDDYNAQPWS